VCWYTEQFNVLLRVPVQQTHHWTPGIQTFKDTYVR